MKVILLEDIEKLGAQGEIVSVKGGYGRNYLIPQKLARLATPMAIKAVEEERRQASRRLMKAKEDAEALAKQMEKLEVVVTAKVGEEDRIFGTVTPQQVALGLATQGITVDRRKVELDEDVRMIGVYTATVKLHPEVSAKVKVRVEPEAAPAEE
jgi:large subunit ribosomal protein L9